MMIEPPVEELSKIAGNKYKLCCLVSKRAEEIQKRNFANEVNPEVKEITEATFEVYNGKVVADE